MKSMTTILSLTGEVKGTIHDRNLLSWCTALADVTWLAGRRVLLARCQTTISLLGTTGLLFAFSSTPVSADLLIYEPFNYAPSNAITDQVNNYSPNSPVTWHSAGTANADPAMVHQIASPAGSLTPPSGFPASYGNAGDMVKSDIGEFARLDLPQTYGINTTLYYSLLLNVPDLAGLNTPNSNLNANNDLIIAFNNTTGASASRPSVWAGELVIRQGTNANTYNLGIRASSTPANTNPGHTYWSADLNPGDTHLVVVRYVQGGDASIETDDSNDLWIDPSPLTFGASEGSEPAPDGSSLGTINKANATVNYAASLLIGAGISDTATLGNPNHTYIDEIRVGTNWADVTSNTAPLIIVTQPKDQRVVVGANATFQAAGFLATAWKWQYSNTVTHTIMDIPGATNTTLTLTNVQLTDSGIYTFVASYGGNSVTSSPANLYVYPDIYYHLAPIWNIAPFSRDYIDTYTSQLPMQRYFAFNSLSNQVLIVSRTNINTLASTGMVYVLDGKTGADLYQMNADSAVINGGQSGVTLSSIDVADDGAVYAANISGGAAAFRVYRWDNSGPATVPVNVYDGYPWGLGTERFGDSLAVRGAGTGTEILLDDNTGTRGAILNNPTSIGSTYPSAFTNVIGGVTGGRTVLFGQTNTFWEKHRGGGLRLASYDIAGFTSTILTNYNNFPSTVGVCGFSFDLNLLCGINFQDAADAPDTLDLFDITDPTQPVFIASYNFPTNSQPNANRTGRVMFVGDRVYALDGNNGFIALAVVPKLSISRSGNSAVLSWNTNFTDFVLQAGTNVVNSTWTNVTPVTIVGQNYQVTQPVTGSRLFYRLKFQ